MKNHSYSLALGLLALLVGCVGKGQIDETNATLQANLGEMRTLNKNFLVASKNFEQLQAPMNSMASGFKTLVEIGQRRDAEFSQLVAKVTEVTNETFGLLSLVNPKTIQMYGERLQNNFDRVSEYTEKLSLEGKNLGSLLPQLISNGKLLLQMGKSLQQLTFGDRATLSGSVAAVVDSTRNLNQATKDTTDDRIEDLEKANRRRVSDDGKPVDNRAFIDELAALNGHLAKIETFFSRVRSTKSGDEWYIDVDQLGSFIEELQNSWVGKTVWKQKKSSSGK